MEPQNDWCILCVSRGVDFQIEAVFRRGADNAALVGNESGGGYRLGTWGLKGKRGAFALPRRNWLRRFPAEYADWRGSIWNAPEYIDVVHLLADQRACGS
ncbi:hypothetical protein HAD_00905 [Hyphomonas adhaerens MHS-3]|uniref:Uncharacterized protein n=1 Tax=Hyphomonas adhaerens MHS-3 TaxID=1280949 RepID=A0A069E356_9PROT|nr:hypothetical protein HAD_00905 [Hyphomonas adhaerens MHS-3]